MANIGFFDKISNIFNSNKHTSIKNNSQTVALLDPLSMDNGGSDVLLEGDDALWAETGPLGTQADVEDYYPSNDKIETYVAKKGDTVKSVAKLFDVSPNTIVWANSVTIDSSLTEGQTLVILPVSGIRYTTQKGDTVESIARKFKADVDDIKTFNGIVTIEVGTQIIIPDGELSAPKPKTVAKNYSGKGFSLPKLVKKGSGIIERNLGTTFTPTGPQEGDAVGRTRHGEKVWGFNAPTYTGYYIFPVDGGTKTQDLHGFNGIDIGKGKGAPIKASASGTVILSRSGGRNGGYGNYVVIAHDNGTQTLYAHNSKNLVSVGDVVTQGQVIALMGRTGHATGNHVHFEVRGAKNPFATAFSNSDSSD